MSADFVTNKDEVVARFLKRRELLQRKREMAATESSEASEGNSAPEPYLPPPGQPTFGWVSATAHWSDLRHRFYFAIPLSDGERVHSRFVGGAPVHKANGSANGSQKAMPTAHPAPSHSHPPRSSRSTTQVVTLAVDARALRSLRKTWQWQGGGTQGSVVHSRPELDEASLPASIGSHAT